MIADSHIHIGRWYDYFLSPDELYRFAKIHRITSFAISSTSVCCDDYESALKELENVINLTNINVVPILWITSNMVISGAINYFLKSRIDWKCIKIHPKIDGKYWLSENNFELLLSIARNLRCPILIHTGEVEFCYPSEYEKIIHDNADIQFIMAHGRPIDQCVSILQKCSNAYVDTAFMPLNDIIRINNLKLTQRILWGSDFPISYFNNKLFYNIKYEYRLLRLKHILSNKDFNQITRNTFKTLFH